MDEQFSIALRRIVRAIDLNSRTLFRRFNLTGPQLAVLQELGRRDEATVGELARAVHLGAPTLTGILDRLERQQLIQRVRSQQDRRRVVAAISEKGRELLEKQPHLLSDRFRRRLRQLPEWKQTEILAVLQQVADMMDPAAEPAAEASPDGSSDGHWGEQDDAMHDGRPDEESADDAGANW